MICDPSRQPGGCQFSGNALRETHLQCPTPSSSPPLHTGGPCLTAQRVCFSRWDVMDQNQIRDDCDSDRTTQTYAPAHVRSGPGRVLTLPRGLKCQIQPQKNQQPTGTSHPPCFPREGSPDPCSPTAPLPAPHPCLLAFACFFSTRGTSRRLVTSVDIHMYISNIKEIKSRSLFMKK